MKKCASCNGLTPYSGNIYCSRVCMTIGELREDAERAERRHEQERQDDREFEIVRVALKTMATDTRFDALASMAMDALDNLQRGRR